MTSPAMYHLLYALHAVQESMQRGPHMRSLLFHPGILQAITGTHPDVLQGLLSDEGEIRLGQNLPDRPGGCTIS